MQVIQLPLKTVLFGLRKLFSLGRGGGKKGGKGQLHPLQSSSATKRGILDMASLTEEELLWVEEVFQRESKREGGRGGREGGREGGFWIWRR